MDEDDDLERLERDLRHVESRLARRADWGELAPRVRRTIQRPIRALAWTIALITAHLALAWWWPPALLGAGGLVLAVLPSRWRAVKERHRALAVATDGDLFALYRRELERSHARHVFGALLNVALALLMLLVAAFARSAIPGLVCAAYLIVAAIVQLFWLLPRASRELRALDGAREGS